MLIYFTVTDPGKFMTALNKFNKSESAWINELNDKSSPNIKIVNIFLFIIFPIKLKILNINA